MTVEQWNTVLAWSQMWPNTPGNHTGPIWSVKLIFVFIMMEMGTKRKKGKGRGKKRWVTGKQRENRAWGYNKASTSTGNWVLQLIVQYVNASTGRVVMLLFNYLRLIVMSLSQILWKICHVYSHAVRVSNKWFHIIIISTWV